MLSEFFPLIAASGLSTPGSLPFSIGFAIHGLKSARATQRIAELEEIAAAQGEELNRLRRTYRAGRWKALRSHLQRNGAPESFGFQPFAFPKSIAAVTMS